MSAVISTNLQFCKHAKNHHGGMAASLKSCLLLPLKTLAHRVSSHVFMDYFQHSTTFARDCCEQFDLALWKCYANEFLQIPTPYNIKCTAKLHQAVHGVGRMFGSLDCTHTYWKNCAKGWTGSYSGKEHKPSIVLEAIVNHHIFLAHKLWLRWSYE